MYIIAEDIGFEPITLELLRTDKTYVKLLKKQQKELEIIKKRHTKDKSTMQRQQRNVVDILVASHDKEKQAQEKTLDKVLKKEG